MNSFVVHPEEGGPFPVVLFYMDAPGKREELHDMARRLAAVGYFVVLPNLYYRRAREYWLKERTEPAMAEMFAHMATLDRADDRARHARRCSRFVDADPPADGKRIGAVGYCMSGPIVMWAAAGFPERHRLHRLDPRRQHGDRQRRLAAPRWRRRSAARATSPAPRSTSGRRRADIDKLAAALRDAGTPHRIEWYPGVEHGFVFPQRVGVYDRAGAERHWERLFALFDRTLRRAP